MDLSIAPLRHRSWASILWAPWWSHVATAFFLLMALAFVIGYAISPVYPTDDLLRHVVSYAWGYSHTKMFALSTLPEYNLYPMFDWITGQLTQSTTPMHAVKIIATTCVAITILSAYKVISYWGQKYEIRKEDIYMATLLFLALITVERASYGRTDAWSLIWALWATTINKDHPKQTIVVLMGAVLLTLSYWLAILVFPFVLISETSKKYRVILFSCLCTFHLSFWMIWSGGDMLHWATMIAKWTANRPVKVGEGLPMMHSFFDIEARLIILVIALGFVSYVSEIKKTKSGEKTLTVIESSVLMAFYLSANMVRYIPIASSAGIKFILKGVSYICLPIPFILMISIWVYGDLILRIESWYLSNHPHVQFILPAGSRVLTAFDVSTYSMINANPGRIEMIPSMEVGAGTKTISKMVEKMSRRKANLVTCNELNETGVTHVVAWNVSNMAPCLKKVERNSDGWDLFVVETK